MNVIAIRAAMAEVLGDVPGINSASGYPPDNIGPLPAAWCGLLDTTIDYMAGMEDNEHTVPVVVVVERVQGRLGSNLKAIETVQEAFMVTMRANFGLPTFVGDNPVNSVMVQRIRQDTVQIGSTPYIGFVADVLVTHKFGVTLN